MRRQAKSLGIEKHVNFLGAVSQERLPALYRRAAVFVAPFVATASGDQEGLGLVTVEAIGCGCPVIVSDLPAVHDVVINGDHIARPADSTDLAQIVIRLLAQQTSERQIIAKEFRRAAIERFDWTQVATGYAKLLRAGNN